MLPSLSRSLTSEGFNDNDNDEAEEEGLDEDEEDVSPFAISENDEMPDIPSDKWDKLSHSDDVEEQSVSLDDILNEEPAEDMEEKDEI